MPRKGFIAKREVAADPIYGSTLVTKFVNSMMWGGKKSTAQAIFYEAMTNLEAKGGGDDALKLFKKAVENVKPMLEVRCRDEEEGRRSSHGGSEQGVRALSLVKAVQGSGFRSPADLTGANCFLDLGSKPWTLKRQES